MNTALMRYIAAAFVGSSVFLVLGYIGFAASHGASDALPFSFWLTVRPIRYGALYWMVFGAIAGAAARYGFKS